MNTRKPNQTKGRKTMESWYEKAKTELEEALTNGDIEDKEFREEAYNLEREYVQHKLEAKLE